MVYVIWELSNYFCTAQAANQAARKKGLLDLSSWFTLIHKGGLPNYCLADATLPGQVNHHPSGMTMAPPGPWHAGVIQVAEETRGTLGSGWAVWIWQLCVVGTALRLHGRVPGSCAFRTRYNVQQGQAEVREANLARGDGKSTQQLGKD